MFTGITEDIGLIKSISDIDPAEYRIETKMDLKKSLIGSSIMCSGICLTVVKKRLNSFSVNISEETLRLTTAKDWQPGTVINLEKSLRVGDEIGGHIVTGHVDGVTKVKEITNLEKSILINFLLPQKMNKFICKKGSISIDGVSLTVNNVSKKSFSVNLIPHTNKITTLGKLEKGDKVNIEIDILARYINKNIRKN